MTSCKCRRCGLFWAFNSGNPENFTAITKFCPLCVAAVFPLAGKAAT